MHFSLSFGTRDCSRSRVKAYRDPGHRHWVLSWRWFVFHFGIYN